eukprot:1194789-Prorocentrum_minimum.AAC.2
MASLVSGRPLFAQYGRISLITRSMSSAGNSPGTCSNRQTDSQTVRQVLLRAVQPDLVDHPLLRRAEGRGRRQVGGEVGGRDPHLAGVEQVVDVLDEPLEHDLRVGEEEHHAGPLHARDLVQLLQVLVELVHAVVPAQLQLEALVLAHEACEAGEALLAAAPDAHQQGVAARLPQDASQPADVLDGIHEENQLHRRRESTGRVYLLLLRSCFEAQARYRSVLQLLLALDLLVLAVLMYLYD